jgi:F-type H+-transporting ATPase subunit delta
MSDQQIARVYAEALFEAASEAGSVQATGSDLGAFARALDESRPLANVVFNPQVEPQAKRRVLAELTGDADRLAAGVLAVLLEKGRIAVTGEVAAQYERLVAEEARTVDVELITAVPVKADLEQRVVDCVRRSTGLEARLSKAIDPQILGGLVLRIGDVIIDGSLRSRLRQLGGRLRSAEVRGDAT